MINILCGLLRGHGFVKYFWRRSVHERVLSNEPNHLSRFRFTYLVIVFFTWRALAGFAGPYFGCVCGHRHFKSAVKAYFQVIVYSLLLPDGLSQSVKWRRREPHPPYDICSAIYCIISQEYEFFYVIYLLPTDDYLMVARGDDFPLNSIYFYTPFMTCISGLVKIQSITPDFTYNFFFLQKLIFHTYAYIKSKRL